MKKITLIIAALAMMIATACQKEETCYDCVTINTGPGWGAAEGDIVDQQTKCGGGEKQAYVDGWTIIDTSGDEKHWVAECY